MIKAMTPIATPATEITFKKERKRPLLPVK
jgi:hypothetical protein